MPAGPAWQTRLPGSTSRHSQQRPQSRNAGNAPKGRHWQSPRLRPGQSCMQLARWPARVAGWLADWPARAAGQLPPHQRSPHDDVAPPAQQHRLALPLEQHPELASVGHCRAKREGGGGGHPNASRRHRVWLGRAGGWARAPAWPHTRRPPRPGVDAGQHLPGDGRSHAPTSCPLITDQQSGTWALKSRANACIGQGSSKGSSRGSSK